MSMFIYPSLQERNAASLLFSALVARIFGVKRDQDEFSDKNTMTARAFFQSYPSLYPLFLSELETAAETVGADANRGCLHPMESALFPLLLLLGKLRPSPVTTGSDQFKVGTVVTESI